MRWWAVVRHMECISRNDCRSWWSSQSPSTIYFTMHITATRKLQQKCATGAPPVIAGLRQPAQGCHLLTGWWLLSVASLSRIRPRSEKSHQILQPKQIKDRCWAASRQSPPIPQPPVRIRRPSPVSSHARNPAAAMALTLASQSSGVPLLPEKQLNEAVVDFQGALTEEQRSALRQIKDIPDADAVLVFTAQLDSNQRQRRGRSIGTRLHSVLQSVREFSAVIDTFVSSNPEIAALIWGSVKLTIQVRCPRICCSNAQRGY